MGRRRTGRWRVLIGLDPEVHDRVRQAADAAGTSVREWVEAALIAASWGQLRAGHHAEAAIRRRLRHQQV